MIKCSECEYGEKKWFPRNGNGASWRSGHFAQEAYICKHPDGMDKWPILFYGKTAPRKCPLKNKPTAERGTANWIEKDGDLYCSSCGHVIPDCASNATVILVSENRFCYYCGRKMEPNDDANRT